MGWAWIIDVAGAATLLGAVAWGLRARRLAAVAAVTGATAAALFMWQRAPARQARAAVLAATPTQARGEFVGSAACRSCHPAAYKTWRDTYHSTMTQRAGPHSVQGLFDGRVLSRGGVAWRVHRAGTRYLATPMQGPPWTPSGPARQVVQTTGSHHRQIYWLAAADPTRGNPLEMLPFLWYRLEQRWMLRAHGFVMPEGKGLQLATWNQRCVHCHSTAGAPRQQGEGFDTQVADLAIACEACHGPGAAHVGHWREPVRRVLARRAAERPHPPGAAQAPPVAQLATAAPRPAHRMVSPERATPNQVNSLCGQCHSIGDRRGSHWDREGSHFRAGGDLHRDRLLVRRAHFMTVDPRMPPEMQKLKRQWGAYKARKTYWPDGEPRVTGREYSQQLESKCHQGGQLTCLTCHQLHGSDPNDMLRGDTDDACATCHAGFDTPQHHHHAAQSPGASCVNCHMAKTNWGLLKAVHSHTIRSPRLRDSLAAGRPNACSTCHLDRSLKWTDRWLSSWYGHPLAALDDDQSTLPAAAWHALTGDAGVRALTARHLGWSAATRASGGPWALPWLAELIADPYPAVRVVAAATLRRLTGLSAFPHERDSSPTELARRRRAVLELWQATKEPGAMPDAEQVDRLMATRDPQPLTLAE